MGMLFDGVAAADATTGTESAQVGLNTAGDVVMAGDGGVMVDPSQLGLPTDPAAQVVMVSGAETQPTTIDVTDASGEVVQQFIIPEDLQLEEGQTLVVITGDDGQPQLAIVNQAGTLSVVWGVE